MGKTIRLNGETYLVVGVAPADFEFFGRMDVWMPLALPSGETNRQTRDLLVVGRMRPGVTAAEAREEMRTLAARVAHGIARNEPAMERARPELPRGSGGPGRPPGDAYPLRHRERRPAPGLCECCQLASGSGLHAGEGDRRPHRFGREPLAGNAPIAGGDFFPGLDWAARWAFCLPSERCVTLPLFLFFRRRDWLPSRSIAWFWNSPPRSAWPRRCFPDSCPPGGPPPRI